MDTPDQKLVKCYVHNYLYDPNLTSGCPMCQKKSEPGPASITPKVFIGIGVVILVIVLLWIAPWKSFGIVLGGVSKIEAKSAYADCRMECAEVAESCDLECLKQEHSRSARNICLTQLNKCDETCNRLHTKPRDMSSHAYHIGQMPPWIDILDSMNETWDQIAECDKKENKYNIRLTISGENGVALDAVAAPYRNNLPAEDCVLNLLKARQYPYASGQSYSFVTVVDPTLDFEKLVLLRAQKDIAEATAIGESGAVESAKTRMAMLEARLEEKERQEKEKLEKEKLSDQNKKADIEATLARNREVAEKLREQLAEEAELAKKYPEKYEVVGDDSNKITSLSKKKETKEEEEYRKNMEKEWREVEKMRRARHAREEYSREKREIKKRRADCEAWRAKMIRNGRRPEEVPSCWMFE